MAVLGGGHHNHYPTYMYVNLVYLKQISSTADDSHMLWSSAINKSAQHTNCQNNPFQGLTFKSAFSCSSIGPSHTATSALWEDGGPPFVVLVVL